MDTQGYDENVFEDIEDKEDEVEVAVDSYQHDTTINAANQEDINAILVDGYEVEDGRHPETNNKLRNRGDTERKIYK